MAKTKAAATEVKTRFRAEQSFFSKETGSQYVKGEYYSVRNGDPWTTLDELVGTPSKPGPWAKSGKISFGGPEATVGGAG